MELGSPWYILTGYLRNLLFTPRISEIIYSSSSSNSSYTSVNEPSSSSVEFQTPPETRRHLNSVRFKCPPTGQPKRAAKSLSPSLLRRSPRSTDSDLDVNESIAQRQLNSLIRTHGYLVKEHVPKSVLERQILSNIRKREQIARMLRNQDLIGALDNEKINAKEPIEEELDPFAFREVLNLVTKVWTTRGSISDEAATSIKISVTSFCEECLQEHNNFRKLHGSKPLVLCEELCKAAQAWANKLAHEDTLVYCNTFGRGENIMISSIKGGLTGSGVTKAWYNSGRNFKYNAVSDIAQAGPFSQIIWRSTEKLGVGLSTTSTGKMVIVARYFPKGNTAGQMVANVRPPIIRNKRSTISRTRHEANLVVESAFVASYVESGVVHCPVQRLRKLQKKQPKYHLLKKCQPDVGSWKCPNGSADPTSRDSKNRKLISLSNSLKSTVKLKRKS